MKTIHQFLLALAILVTASLSCNKSDLAPTAKNTTSGANLNVTATGTGCGTHDCVFTQGGYGAPNGQPHDFMYANFYKAFPKGFPVGAFGPNKCADGHTVFMSSPEAVTATLPVGGKPAVLTKNYRDKSPNNVLVGQLITLCLNLGLEPYCPTFTSNTTPLTDMIIASGPFKGMTVNAFFQLAGSVLGGCNTQYTPSQVNETATKINENYESGNHGFLKCP
jgi:hypothetical protein